MPLRSTEGFIGMYITPYIDDLMTDMDLEPKRAGGFVREYLTTFKASRFAGLGDERRRAREALTAPRQ